MLPRVGFALATLLAALACGPSLGEAPAGRRGPLSSPAGSTTQIDVRTLDARPKLAVIRRVGDPLPALVIAVAGGRGPAGHAALAGMLAARLRGDGHDVDVESDGMGLRLSATLQPDALESLLSAWVTAVGAPVQKRDVEAANGRLSQLRAAPLPSPVLSPLAACSGDPFPLAADAKDQTASELDALRRAALVMERTAVALVGDADATEAVTDALASVDGWPRGDASGPEAPKASHGAFLSTTLPVGRARLHVALHVEDPVMAVGAAQRLRRGPPLSTKLDALSSPWRLASLQAVARPRGGCLRVALEPVAEDVQHVDELLSSATRAVRTVWREMALQGRLETDPFLITTEIVAAGDARDAAARAAWWALSTPLGAPPALSTALEIGAPGKVPFTDAEGGALDEATLHARYGQSVRKLDAPHTGPIAARRLHAEPGQGKLWMLLASPCPMRHEGLWDAGLSATAATAVAAHAHDPEVTVEPWVSADGVGIIAHGALAGPDETPRHLAERIARVAAEAYVTVPHDASAFAVARQSALAHTGGPLGEPFFTLALRLMPDHPSWIAPWGTSERQAGLDLLDAAQRWRGILHAPARVAVVANVDATQAEHAAAIVDHWLLPEAVDRPCAELARRELPQAGSYELNAPSPVVMLGVRYEGAAERPAAELLAAALGGSDGLLRAGLAVPWQVEVLGGSHGGAVVISARVAGDVVPEARTVAVGALKRLARQGPDAATLERATARVAAAKGSASRHPRERLVALWRGAKASPTSPEAWRSFLARRADESKLVIVTAR